MGLSDRQLELSYGLAIGAATETLVRVVVDALVDKSNRSISHQEMSTALVS